MYNRFGGSTDEAVMNKLIKTFNELGLDLATNQVVEELIDKLWQ
jgi:hypothetical protein